MTQTTQEINTTATPNSDGTVNVTHYGTRYSHWWVGHFHQRRGYVTVDIFGKTGGEAILRLDNDGVERLRTARDAAQALAATEETAASERERMENILANEGIASIEPLRGSSRTQRLAERERRA